MTTSEEWQDIIQDFAPKTEESKRKEVEAETRRLQLPLPDMIIRNAPTSKLPNKTNTDSKSNG